MIRPNRGLFAFAAAALSAALLAACSMDPVTASLRPTVEDKTASKNAPAGAYGALLRVGEATRQAGDPASAVVFFRKAHAADPFKPEALVKLGLALSDLGQYNDAAQMFRDALDLAHNNSEALRGLGGALIALNQPEVAVDQFKAANAIEPDYRNFNGLGVASDHLGRHKEAQQYYDSGIKLYPNNLTLLNNFGLSQILSRDYDAAIATLITAAQQPGATARQRQNLALAYGIAGRDADAERIARLDLDRQSVQSNLAYYGILRAAGDEALLTAVLGVHPQAASLTPSSGSAPAPANIAPQAGSANPTSSPAGQPMQPAPAKPGDFSKPEARTEPETDLMQPAKIEPAVALRTDEKPAKTVASESKAQQSGGSPQPAATTDAAQPATTQPQQPEDIIAAAPPASTRETSVPGAAAAQASEILNSGVAPAASAEESRGPQTAAAQDSSAPPIAVIAGRYGQAPVIAPDSAAVQPPTPAAARPASAMASGDSQLWYAAPMTATPDATRREDGGATVFARIWDSLFGNSSASQQAAADAAAVKPAAGGGEPAGPSSTAIQAARTAYRDGNDIIPPNQRPAFVNHAVSR